MNTKTCLLLLAGLLGLAGSVRAQWVTQTIPLRAGWNAVFLHVDASHATLDELVGVSASVTTPIERVWRWNPHPSTAQFVQSPQQPIENVSQWSGWHRDTPNSPLQRLTGNLGYLVYATADVTWHLVGQPVLPEYRWSTSGLNFFGFPTVPTGPPNFEAFLAGVPSLQLSQIFQYAAGELGPNNPRQVFALRTTPVRRGEAFWIRAGEVYNHYFGPFAVTAAGGGRAAFEDTLSAYSFRLRNQTAQALTVAMRWVPSGNPPTGQTPILGMPPLLVRGDLDPSTMTYDSAALSVNTTRSWSLAPTGEPGSEVEVVLGLDRSAITVPMGGRLAGVLELTDSLGHTRVDMGVSAVAGSRAGLWVGAAAVTQVGQYLPSYQRDADNQPVVQPDGSYKVTHLNTEITAVPAAFPLRLIVHQQASGPALLLQQVYTGFNGQAEPVVALQESAMDPNLLPQARRLSAAHLPWSAANAGWQFSGPLAPDAVVTATVTTPFNDQASNPFLHTYHPDHDNLDPRFGNELPVGAESFTVVREITLSVRPPANDFESRVATGRSLSGTYAETVRVVGLTRPGNTSDTRRFEVQGVFELHRLTDVSTLIRVP
jgi:hypothetical protein